MPQFLCKYDGQHYDVNLFTTRSFKAGVLNAAIQDGNFRVVDVPDNPRMYYYRCTWCGIWYPHAAIHGGHIIDQRLAAHANQEVVSLYPGEGAKWNVTVQCSTCNWFKNRDNGVQTRDDYFRNALGESG